MAFTANSFKFNAFGGNTVIMADLAVSEAYAEGGISLPFEKLFGLHDVEMAIIESQGGLSFNYDYANKKIKAFKPAPPIIYDELQQAAVATSAGISTITLNYPAAFIMNVAYAGQNYAMRSTGATLAANQCCLTSQISTGTRTKLNLYTVTILTNGTFTGNATGWTLAAGWTYATNAVNKDADGVGTLSEDAGNPVAATYYDLTFTISALSVGSVLPNLGGTDGVEVSDNGTYVQRILTTNTDVLKFTPSSTARFTIDNISVKAVPSAVVTYVTQAWKEVYDNLVQDESVTLATGDNTLTSGNKILAFMYLDQITATAAALLPMDEDDTSASGSVVVKFNSATAQLNCHSAQNTKVCKITYIKQPTSGILFDHKFNNESATKTGSDPYVNTFDYPILLWGYTGYAPSIGGTCQVLIDYAATPGAGEVIIDWYTPGIRGGGAPAAGTVAVGKSNLVLTAAGVWGRVSDIMDLRPLEMISGRNLTVTSLRVMLIGH